MPWASIQTELGLSCLASHGRGGAKLAGVKRSKAVGCLNTGVPRSLWRSQPLPRWSGERPWQVPGDRSSQEGTSHVETCQVPQDASAVVHLGHLLFEFLLLDTFPRLDSSLFTTGLGARVAIVAALINVWYPDPVVPFTLILVGAAGPARVGANAVATVLLRAVMNGPGMQVRHR